MLSPIDDGKYQFHFLHYRAIALLRPIRDLILPFYLSVNCQSKRASDGGAIARRPLDDAGGRARDPTSDCQPTRQGDLLTVWWQSERSGGLQRGVGQMSADSEFTQPVR